MAIGPSPIVHCPTLSTSFVGVLHSCSTSSLSVHQFRGITYASVPARFRRSCPRTVYPRVTDATAHGPISPQSKQKLAEETLPGVQPEQLQTHNSAIQDEFECLNLTVTMPGGLTSEALVPVMVWIHGGENIQGSGSAWTTDAGRFVAKSMELKKPVIVVTINYRLGLFGFGASPALEKDNRLSGDSGVGNYGLYDQINALEWIQNHIASFGGDPSQVTLFGESSGAVNIHSILLSSANQARRLATRAIIQSGVVNPSTVPSTVSQGSLMSCIMSHLGVTTIEELRSVDANVLVAHTPSTMSATDDGVFFRHDWKKRLSPGGVDSIIIGDCMYESVPWTVPVSLWTTSQIIRRVRAIIRSVYKADSFLRTYGITWNTSDEDAAQSVLNIVTDADFAWPTETIAHSARSSHDLPVYRYLFDQDSPCQWNGAAQHADSLYLFDNVPTEALCHVPDVYSDSDSDADSDGGYDYHAWSDTEYNVSRVRQAMQERWIAFAHGERPWNPDKVYVFGPEGEVGERGVEEVERRRRMQEWREAFGSVSPELVHKIAVELRNGPPVALKARF